jgi:RHS repeat-associated protein
VFDPLNIRLKQEVSSNVANTVEGRSTFLQVNEDKLLNDVLKQEVWSSSYDGAGEVTARTSGTGVAQSLTWDSFGRLVKITQSGGDDFNWNTTYDGLGRRIQTTFKGSTVSYYYDPEVEFLELGHSLNGNRTWNLFGPDRSGTYGGAQGIGGLEAEYDQNSGSTHGVVNNYFGDTLGLVGSAGFAPYKSVLGSYGAMPGSQEVNSNLQPQWRGHYLDWTGFYSMGARYYEPKSGRFLSADPLGHDSSLSLYDYCGGDPVNGLDPDGRCVEGGVKGYTMGGFADYDNIPQAVGGFVGTGLSYITPGLGEVAAIRDLSAGLWNAGQALSDIWDNGLHWGNGLKLGFSAVATGLGGRAVLGPMERAVTSNDVVKATAYVFRQGTFADEAVGWEGNLIKGQHWSQENPLTTPNYAQKYGLPAENTGKPDWIIGGRIKGSYTTRPAPPSHNNPLNVGEGTEIIPNNPNDVMLDFFHMPD